MLLFNVDWKAEMLIYPAVKRAVSVLAQVTLWGYVAVFLLAPPLSLILLSFAPSCDCLPFFGALEHFVDALLLLCLYLLALWCHQVLLACRGNGVTRWMLLLLAAIAGLHTVCEGGTALTGRYLLANQDFLPAALNTALVACVSLCWGRMASASLRLRVRLLLFAGALLGRYIFGLSPFVPLFDVLLVWAAWRPLRLLAHYAPLIVSLPPVDEPKACS